MTHFDSGGGLLHYESTRVPGDSSHSSWDSRSSFSSSPSSPDCGVEVTPKGRLSLCQAEGHCIEGSGTSCSPHGPATVPTQELSYHRNHSNSLLNKVQRPTLFQTNPSSGSDLLGSPTRFGLSNGDNGPTAPYANCVNCDADASSSLPLDRYTSLRGSKTSAKNECIILGSWRGNEDSVVRPIICLPNQTKKKATQEGAASQSREIPTSWQSVSCDYGSSYSAICDAISPSTQRSIVSIQGAKDYKLIPSPTLRIPLFTDTIKSNRHIAPRQSYSLLGPTPSTYCYASYPENSAISRGPQYNGMPVYPLAHLIHHRSIPELAVSCQPAPCTSDQTLGEPSFHPRHPSGLNRFISVAALKSRPTPQISLHNGKPEGRPLCSPVRYQTYHHHTPLSNLYHPTQLNDWKGMTNHGYPSRDTQRIKGQNGTSASKSLGSLLPQNSLSVVPGISLKVTKNGVTKSKQREPLPSKTGKRTGISPWWRFFDEWECQRQRRMREKLAGGLSASECRKRVRRQPGACGIVDDIMTVADDFLELK